MKPKTTAASRITGAIILIALAASGPAAAQSYPKSGKYDFTSCWTAVNTVIAYSATHSAMSYEMTGSIRSNPPGGIFDNSAFRCVGMSSSFNGKAAGNTVCESVDPQGDKRLSTFVLTSDGKAIRETVAGTGKYEGMDATGIAVPLGPFPAIKPGTTQACNHQTGTYTLKN